MLAKCVSTSCSTRFRYLEDGRLFRVQSDHPSPLLNHKKSEYFWLCASCSRSMTLRLNERCGVTVVPFTESEMRASDHAEFILLDRQEGLTLTSLVGAFFFTRAS